MTEELYDKLKKIQVKNIYCPKCKKKLYRSNSPRKEVLRIRLLDLKWFWCEKCLTYWSESELKELGVI